MRMKNIDFNNKKQPSNKDGCVFEAGIYSVIQRGAFFYVYKSDGDNLLYCGMSKNKESAKSMAIKLQDKKWISLND